jgi:hypothetical protein
MVYKAIISGRVFVEPEMGSNIEFFTYTDNDTERIDVFYDVDLEVLKRLEHHLQDSLGLLEDEGEHFFLVIVYAKFVSERTVEGIQYSTEYDVHEITTLEDLDKGAEF